MSVLKELSILRPPGYSLLKHVVSLTRSIEGVGFCKCTKIWKDIFNLCVLSSLHKTQNIAVEDKDRNESASVKNLLHLREMQSDFQVTNICDLIQKC